MNDSIVEEIKIELEKLEKISTNNLFTVDYLSREYKKITSAREKDYPTYRSEYRVVKTLIRQRNRIIYQLRESHPELLPEFITIFKLLSSLLKSIGEVFSFEESIARAADEFDKTWKR